MSADWPAWTGGDLPRLAQDMTAEQVEAVVLWLEQLPLGELRQRQAISREQIGMAYRKGMEAETLSEQIKFDIVSDAVSRQVFGVPMGGLHSRIGA